MALVLSAAPLVCAAQVAAPGSAGLDGDWTVTLRTAVGLSRLALLHVAGSCATWLAHVQSRQNPCVERSVPVQERLSRDEWCGGCEPIGDSGARVMTPRRP